jgi:lysophospholipase L1-like esterase
MSARWRARHFVAIAFAALLAGEIGVRILLDADSTWNMRLGGLRRFDEHTRFRLKSDYEIAPGVWTNEHGYLAPRGLGFEKPRDRLRLVYLGDSASVQPPQATYPAQVERMLAARGLRVETLNAAVPGFDSGQARVLFEREIQRYDADHLFVYLGWNDIGKYGPEGLPYKRADQGYEISTAQRIFSEIYLARFLYSVQDFRRRRQPSVDAPLAPDEKLLYESYHPTHFEENLRAILALAKQRYPRVAVMNLATITSDAPTEWEMRTAHFPVGMSKNVRKLHALVVTYNGVVDAVARELEVERIDAYRAFDSPEARRDFTDSAHMNASGTRRLAELAAAVVLRDR